MENDDNMPEPTVDEILEGFGVDLENLYIPIDELEGLDDDQRAELIRKIEEIEELVNDARKILATSNAND